MLDSARLLAAWHRVRDDLLAERTPAGHWVGELSTSALSTATAVSALCLMQKFGGSSGRPLEPLIAGGTGYLLTHQNADGGWGDTDKSYSNIATTLLAIAALHLAGQVMEQAELLQRAEAYVDGEGRLNGLRARYGKDKTFVVPILTNCALAGLVPWKVVSPLPFELACVPQAWYRFVRMPVVSYAVPALVAIGQAKFFHDPPWNPLPRLLRAVSVNRSLKVLQDMQPASGGYLEAVPLTSFVVMSLASIGRADHPVAQSGMKFLIDSVRPDGSWPIDTNLATWVTTLSVNALGGVGDWGLGVGERRGDGAKEVSGPADLPASNPGLSTSYSVRNTSSPSSQTLTPNPLPWILSCQHTQRHPFTGAEPGGWGWSDLSGAVPDADDTPGAMLALAQFDELPQARTKAAVAARASLLDLQNADGGWPTFCRGWTGLPFDRSGVDLTAHVLRALHAWRAQVPLPERAMERGWRYIESRQNADGSWRPLWFGNQERLDEENPIYGTAKVLFAYRDLGRLGAGPVKRAVEWLLANQHADGSWGGDRRGVGDWELGAGGGTAASREALSTQSSAPGTESVRPPFPAPRPLPSQAPNSQPPAPSSGSTEETSLAVEALLAFPHRPDCEAAAYRGLVWLVNRVERGEYREPAPIGFYFAKLWYYERLYPIIFAASALRHAVQALHPHPASPNRNLTPSTD